MTFNEENLPRALIKETMTKWQAGNTKFVVARLRLYKVIPDCASCFNAIELRQYMHIMRIEIWKSYLQT